MEIVSDSRGRGGIGLSLGAIPWGILALVLIIAVIGIVMLYSASGGSMEPWAERQMYRLFLGVAVFAVLAFVPIYWWPRLVGPFYAGSIILLVVVLYTGDKGGGAQRWIDFGLFRLQPSELAKLAVIMGLAYYYHHWARWSRLALFNSLPPLAIIGLPVLLVLKQPDLGTAVVMGFCGMAVIFLAGERLRYFFSLGFLALAATPILWNTLYHYQKQRVIFFLNPERDPLGAGYHVLQSKIAIGSGGIFGKGFLKGSQSHLDFLPEKQTDFIFTMLAEEMGYIGVLVLLGLYGALIIACHRQASRQKMPFAQLLIGGLTAIIFIHVAVNVAMVSGMLPVVGVPLPLVSYGGSFLMTVFIGLGVIASLCRGAGHYDSAWDQ